LVYSVYGESGLRQQPAKVGDRTARVEADCLGNAGSNCPDRIGKGHARIDVR
jgi:hypothetical protein